MPSSVTPLKEHEMDDPRPLRQRRRTDTTTSRTTHTVRFSGPRECPKVLTRREPWMTVAASLAEEHDIR